MSELEQLTAGLEALARAGRVPLCVDRPEWTSEDAEDRAAAAEVCGWCPMARPCLAAGVSIRASFGVWGGTDMGDRAARRAARADR